MVDNEGQVVPQPHQHLIDNEGAILRPDGQLEQAGGQLHSGSVEDVPVDHISEQVLVQPEESMTSDISVPAQISVSELPLQPNIAPDNTGTEGDES